MTRRLPLLLLAASAVLLAVASVTVSAQSDPSFVTPGGYRAEFNGNSGKMKLFPAAEGASKFIQLSWDKIEELDVDGKKVQSVNNFASQPFTISGPADVEYDAGSFGKVNATKLTLDATVTPTGAGAATAARFVVSVYAFRNDVVVPYGNTTVAVQRDHLKFTVDVSDWPFRSAANTLTFGAQVLTPGSASGKKQPSESADAAGDDVYAFEQGALLVTQRSAIVDGERTVEVNSTLYQQGSKSGVQWSFPSFTRTLEYDPSFGFAANSGAGAAAASAATLLLALLAACVLLAQ